MRNYLRFLTSLISLALMGDLAYAGKRSTFIRGLEDDSLSPVQKKARVEDQHSRTPFTSASSSRDVERESVDLPYDIFHTVATYLDSKGIVAFSEVCSDFYHYKKNTLKYIPIRLWQPSTRQHRLLRNKNAYFRSCWMTILSGKEYNRKLIKR